jgi:tRNA-specific adenosine deaminase 3
VEKEIIEKDCLEKCFEIKRLPYTQPINENQYLLCKQYWPLSNLPTSLSKLAYTHTNEEFKEISGIINILKNLNYKFDICSILYDPVNKKILTKSKSDSKFNPIDHSIMKLINQFSEKLTFKANSNIELNPKKKLLGIKNENSPYIEYLDDLDSLNPSIQYYLEKFYVFTMTEPCIMCAMAMVHSRVERVYFSNPDLKQGAMNSRLKINNYNLNHSYLIFKFE